MGMVLGLVMFVAAAEAQTPATWQLLALDSSAQTAVFVNAADELCLLHVQEALADTGFILHAVQSDRVTLQLKRAYQGLPLQQQLPLGAIVDPQAVAQMEEADRRAARAESLIMTPVERVTPPTGQ